VSERTADDHPHGYHVPTAATLCPSAPGSRPTYRGPDHRYGSRSPALDGAGVARRGAEGRGQSGGGGPHRTELRQEILKLRRRVEKLAALLRLSLALLHTSGFSLSRSASAGGRSQAADPKRRGSGARVSPVASGPPVPASVAESVSGLASTADRVRARRSIVLSSHVTASTDALRGPGDRGHGHLARVPSRPDRHPRRPRAAARHRVGVGFDLVRCV
jgi:hypothetical protein